jgi:hypothetical protein
MLKRSKRRIKEPKFWNVKQAIPAEQIANPEHAERSGTSLLILGPVSSESHPRHFAPDVDGLANATEFSTHCAPDHKEQGHSPVARSSR